MHLRNVTLFNFKNYARGKFEFTPGINCIVGDNGTGKTNLLDAIYFLCLTKSAFQSSDQLVLKDGESQASVRGEFEKDGATHSVTCKIGISMRKTVSCDDQEYDRYSEHIGRFTSVLIHPHDVDYVRMASDIRRKLFDGILSQSDHQYLDDLLTYNRILKQRNAALKSMREGRYRDDSLLDSYDDQMNKVAPGLIEKRAKIVDDIRERFGEIYKILCDDKEEVAVLYSPSIISDSFISEFQAGRANDLDAGRSLQGPHRDDFTFLIDDHDLKNFGSQGQQKSYMLALKLSFLNLIEGKPLLLLDDIFDRLDTGRIHHLMKLIQDLGLQSFITDARAERVKEIMTELGVKAHTIYI